MPEQELICSRPPPTLRQNFAQVRRGSCGPEPLEPFPLTAELGNHPAVLAHLDVLDRLGDATPYHNLLKHTNFGGSINGSNPAVAAGGTNTMLYGTRGVLRYLHPERWHRRQHLSGAYPAVWIAGELLMRLFQTVIFGAGLLLAISASAQATLQAREVRRFQAEEAHQGVATDERYFYAIADHEIGKYNKATGKRVGGWKGEPPAFIHINSCTAVKTELVCAMSNFPGVPMISSVERFDRATMRHTGTHSFGPGHGSLTWIDWHRGSWWACFANYDGKGGEPGRDHRSTVLVRYDEQFQQQESWLFPEDVLDSFGHMSASGGRWGTGDYLYVTGHDLPEMYVLKLPEGGARLQHVSTIAMSTGGQAFDWDYNHPERMWSIERKGSAIVESQMPSTVK